jgi:hypothetical protein
MVDASTALRSAFDLGAHFVLYKPVSAERAKASFRAARALMKRERRRNIRVPVESPITVRINDGAAQFQAVTTDIGEGGVAVQLPRRVQSLGPVSVHFPLPGVKHTIECLGETAWDNAGRQFGIRFIDLAPDSLDQLKSWLERHSPEFETEDPPVPCQLLDLSAAGCYLQSTSPFPVNTTVILSLENLKSPIQAQGIVRLMHPEIGMGVEFAQATALQKQNLKKFTDLLAQSDVSKSTVLVEPEGLDGGEQSTTCVPKATARDPLLDLFRNKAELAPDAFHIELRKRRSLQAGAGSRG